MRARTADPEPLAYPVETAAELLGIGRTLTYDLIRRGELASLKVGRRRLVTRDALDDYLTRTGNGADQ